MPTAVAMTSRTRTQARLRSAGFRSDGCGLVVSGDVVTAYEERGNGLGTYGRGAEGKVEVDVLVLAGDARKDRYASRPPRLPMRVLFCCSAPGCRVAALGENSSSGGKVQGRPSVPARAMEDAFRRRPRELPPVRLDRLERVPAYEETTLASTPYHPAPESRRHRSGLEWFFGWLRRLSRRA